MALGACEAKRPWWSRSHARVAKKPSALALSEPEPAARWAQPAGQAEHARSAILNRDLRMRSPLPFRWVRRGRSVRAGRCVCERFARSVQRERQKARGHGGDLAPWPALILKLGSVEQETDDEEEPV